MGCRPEWLLGADDGSLTPGERRWLEAHLARCPACRREQEELRRLGQLLRRVPEPEPPRQLVDAIVGQVRFREARRRRHAWKRRFWQGAGVGVVATLLIAAAWGLGSRLVSPPAPVFASTMEAVVSEHSRQARGWPPRPGRGGPRRRAPFAPTPPAWVPPGYAFVDGGVGELGDREVIHWRFDDGAELLSVFQMPAKDEDRRRHGGELEMVRVDGWLVASGLARGYLFVVVGRLSPGDAEAMLAHLRPPGETDSL